VSGTANCNESKVKTSSIAQKVKETFSARYSVAPEATSAGSGRADGVQRQSKIELTARMRLKKEVHHVFDNA
jgi:hypothetical protein